MSYSKRTCNQCGYKDIQPNMKQVEIDYISGSSQAELSGRALLSATLFGSKKGSNQVNNWLTGNTKRQYKRKRLVWVCNDNCGRKNEVNISVKRKIIASQKLTKESSQIQKIEEEINQVNKLKSDELRLIEAEARIKELIILERESRSLFDWFVYYLWNTIKISFGLFLIFVLIFFIFR
jgi:hypothetical protein